MFCWLLVMTMVSKFGFAPAENVAVPLTAFPPEVVPVKLNVSARAEISAEPTTIKTTSKSIAGRIEGYMRLSCELMCD
jgi:hypothetical protein